MHAKRPAGQKASALKYDILTAMGCFGLSQDKTRQKLVLRFIALITARYNWRRDELAVGQREIARLWHVDERTVKREMAKLRAMGWLVVKRQGTRGRVSEYGIDLDRILADTQPCWASVGPDFEYRMTGAEEVPQNVIPMTPSRPVAAPDVDETCEWSLARALLHQEDPSLYTAWVQSLTKEGRAGARLLLRAPSRFHATYVQSHLKPKLLAACREVDENISDVIIQI